MEDYADLEDYQVYACGSPVMVESGSPGLYQQRKLPSGQSGVDSNIYKHIAPQAG